MNDRVSIFCWQKIQIQDLDPLEKFPRTGWSSLPVILLTYSEPVIQSADASVGE